MSEPRSLAIASPVELVRTRSAGLLQSAGNALGRAAKWAANTAQTFGSVLSVLMGPAVFCAYAFAFWSLAANLGWTDTFLYGAGPLSNWLIWLGLAVLLHIASQVLKRRSQTER